MTPQSILWIDSIGAIVVGIVMLILQNFLQGFYQLPQELILFLGITNVLYGIYSGSLAISRKRSQVFIIFLIIANLAWGLVCSILFAKYYQTASIFGKLQIGAEGIYVSMLALIEWWYRKELVIS
ncbi:MAG: hypothetical protein AAF518_17275 [Spirochaetota bacterium]